MNEIGFIEEFALSEDRGKTLEKLIQGTEDYYHYHCLHLMNTGKLPEASELIDQWKKEHGSTDRVEQMLLRRALLGYQSNKEQNLGYLPLFFTNNSFSELIDHSYYYSRIITQDISSMQDLKKLSRQYDREKYDE